LDNINKKERSRVMAAVKQKDTKPEMKVRSFLHKHGLRYRLHDIKLPGKPDLVFSRFRTVHLSMAAFGTVIRTNNAN
jgi:DNA mismatch endonuclease (patch repair protein)